MRALVVFQRELRITENPLLQLPNEVEEALFVFIKEDRLQAINPIGWPRMDPKREIFLAQALRGLQHDLSSHNQTLVLRSGRLSEEIERIRQYYSWDLLQISQEPGHEEAYEYTRLTQKYSNIRWVNSNGLYHEKELPFDLRKLPGVFTEFRKSVEENSKIRASTSLRQLPPPPSKDILERLQTPTNVLEKTIDEPASPSPPSVISFYGDEKAAIQRVDHFFEKTESLSRYKENRNSLFGANDSSKFSPWLAFGVLSPVWLFERIQEFEENVVANESTYWLGFEILWREFFRWWFYRSPKSFFQFRGLDKTPPPIEEDFSIFETWCKGETSQPLVNANMKELNQTGYMSNRGRQIVASYLIWELKQDWRWGAMYFESRLIDYDVSSNWGNWAYLAGVGNDPRSGRRFNIPKQTQRFDSEGTYRDRWLKASPSHSNKDCGSLDG